MAPGAADGLSAGVAVASLVSGGVASAVGGSVALGGVAVAAAKACGGGAAAGARLPAATKKRPASRPLPIASAATMPTNTGRGQPLLRADGSVASPPGGGGVMVDRGVRQE